MEGRRGLLRGLLLFLEVGLLFVGITGGETHAKEEEVCGWVYLCPEEEGVWSLWVTPSLGELTQGRVMALLLTLWMEEGACQATLQGEGETLRLTVGEWRQGQVSLLLDGQVERGTQRGEAENGKSDPLLLLRVSPKTPNDPPKKGGYMGITGDKEGRVTLYCREKEGHAELLLGVSEEGPPWERETGSDVEGETGSDTGERMVCETRSESALETEGEASTGAEEKTPLALPRFLGCRETSPREGEYTVQFLFEGEGGPVVVMEGGGLLRLQVSRRRSLVVTIERAVKGSLQESLGGVTVLEGGLTLCSFHGLSPLRDYRFGVCTQEGMVYVEYKEGRFVGYS